jgi:hypothetical protein
MTKIVHKEVDANPNRDQPFGLGIFASDLRARVVTDEGKWSLGYGDSEASAIADAVKRINDGREKH